MAQGVQLQSDAEERDGPSENPMAISPLRAEARATVRPLEPRVSEALRLPYERNAQLFADLARGTGALSPVAGFVKMVYRAPSRSRTQR